MQQQLTLQKAAEAEEGPEAMQLTMQHTMQQKQKQGQLLMQQLPMMKVETEAEAEAMSQQIYGEQMVSL